MAPGGGQQFFVLDIPYGLGGEALGHIRQVCEQLTESDVGRVFAEIVEDA